MLDGIGSLGIREQNGGRVVLGLSPVTRGLGAVIAGLGAYGIWMLWGASPLALAVPTAILGLGAIVMTLERKLVFERAAGTVSIRQSVLGLGTRSEVPLFHLRAVVVIAPDNPGAPGARYVAYLDRRVGTTIFLDESRRCARLLRIAEAIAEVAELRLEYEAGAA